MAKTQDAQEWLDGFLLVGNQPALDLLNTKLIDKGETVELLTDPTALGRWFLASGLVRSTEGEKFVHDWAGDPKTVRFLQELLVYRERLRATVVHLEAGRAPDKKFLAELNQLLQLHPSRIAMRWKAGSMEQGTVFEPSAPSDFWALIAAASAALLSQVQYSRIRKCESCIVHFLDISKKGARRWCSMNLCGNKVKVAAYQQRRRDSAR